MEGAHISVISVPVSNPDRSKEFYVGVLGFEVEMDQSSPAMRWVMLRLPGSGTAITLTTWFETMPAGSLRGTVMSVPDVEAAAADLRAKGAIDDDAEIESAPWGRWVTVEDPDGNGWIVQQDAEGPVELQVAD
ncbi:MAG: VOC family protein [Acidimicrobiales bacterium]|jgi:catechol 2,3-dioxygenase-like lactoylglutathione lyase family enzyme